jgi:anti-sigma regulatory factor (Ser/Thr protein kinase)
VVVRTEAAGGWTATSVVESRSAALDLEPHVAWLLGAPRRARSLIPDVPRRVGKNRQESTPRGARVWWGSDTGGVDRAESDESDEAARFVEDASTGPAVAPESPTVDTTAASKSSHPSPEPAIASGIVRRPDEMDVAHAQIVETAAQRSDVVAEPSSVEITPLSDLDPSNTAVEPELASELAEQAHDVISETAVSESPVVEPEHSGARLSAEVLHVANPADGGLGAPESVADVPEVCERTFPAVALSVPEARRFAVQALADVPADVPADVVEDVRLMVSELASNAIEHPMTSFQLTVHRGRRWIRVEVTDFGGGTPAVRATHPGVLRGRGLQIVDAISTQWGVHQDSDSGKTVWFTRDLEQ